MWLFSFQAATLQLYSMPTVNKEGLVVIITAFVINIFFAIDVPSCMINVITNFSLWITANVCIGFSVLLFPVFGLIADVWLTRYRMLQIA